MTTTLFDLNGIAKALAVATARIGAADWQSIPANELQGKLLARLPAATAGLERITELKGFAAATADEINRALEAAGFDIRLDPWPESDLTFGVAALLNLGIQWRQPGETTQGWSGDALEVRGKPAFQLGTSRHGVRFAEVAGASEPVVVIPTRSADTVFLHRSNGPPSDGFELYDLAREIVEARPAAVHQYSGVIVPMVNADQEVDISWMAGVRSGEWKVMQAMQQVRFAMNHLGARVQSATAVGVLGSAAAPVYYTLDGPFVAVVQRPDVAVPIFAGYIGEDSWGDPGDRVE